MMDTRLTRAFLDYLVEQGVLNDDSVSRVLDRQREMTIPIGRLALQTRTMTMREVNAALSVQLETKLRFGRQAIELGFIDQNDLDFLLNLQDQNRPNLGRVLQDLEIIDRHELDELRHRFLESAAEVLA